jgi:hypothetical protein
MITLRKLSLSAAILTFVAGSAFAAAPPNTVRLHASFFNTSTQPGATVTVQKTLGPFKTDALVFIIGNGRSQPTTNNAGTVVRIKRDAVVFASDAEFINTFIPNLPEEVNAARNIILKHGQITTIAAEVSPLGPGGQFNTNTLVELKIDAIQICSGTAC